jgi:hypothetical protein
MFGQKGYNWIMLLNANPMFGHKIVSYSHVPRVMVLGG